MRSPQFGAGVPVASGGEVKLAILVKVRDGDAVAVGFAPEGMAVCASKLGVGDAAAQE